MDNRKQFTILIGLVISLFSATGIAAGETSSTAGTPGAAGAPVTVETKGEVNQCIDNATFNAKVEELKECDTKLSSCLQKVQVLIVGITQLTDGCWGTLSDEAKKLAPRTIADPPRNPVKPVCEPGTRYVPATNTCVCDDQAFTLPPYPGDDGGVSVRIERQSVPVKKNGQVVFACVATHESILKLYDSIDTRIKRVCDPTATNAWVGGPEEKHMSVYRDNGKDMECGALKAYLDELIVWKRSFKNAKLENGDPIPLNVENWELLWRQLQAVAEQANNACHQEQDGTWVHCPPPPVIPTRDDLQLGAAVVGEYQLRFVGPDSMHLKLDVIVAKYLTGRFGIRPHAELGVSFNGDKPRFAAGGGFNAMVDVSSDSDGSLNVHFGPELRTEPTLGLSDVFGVGFGAGMDIGLGKITFLNIGAVVGANTYEYYDDGERLGFRSPWKPFGALRLGFGLRR